MSNYETVLPQKTTLLVVYLSSNYDPYLCFIVALPSSGCGNYNMSKAESKVMKYNPYFPLSASALRSGRVTTTASNHSSQSLIIHQPRHGTSQKLSEAALGSAKDTSQVYFPTSCGLFGQPGRKYSSESIQSIY